MIDDLEPAAPQAPASTGNAAPRSFPESPQQPAEAAASKDDLLAEFAELVLRSNAARMVS